MCSSGCGGTAESSSSEIHLTQPEEAVGRLVWFSASRIEQILRNRTNHLRILEIKKIQLLTFAMVQMSDNSLVDNSSSFYPEKNKHVAVLLCGNVRFFRS